MRGLKRNSIDKMRREVPSHIMDQTAKNLRVRNISSKKTVRLTIPVTFKLAYELGRGTSTKPMGNMPSAGTVKTGMR